MYLHFLNRLIRLPPPSEHAVAVKRLGSPTPSSKEGWMSPYGRNHADPTLASRGRPALSKGYWTKASLHSYRIPSRLSVCEPAGTRPAPSASRHTCHLVGPPSVRRFAAPPGFVDPVSSTTIGTLSCSVKRRGLHATAPFLVEIWIFEGLIGLRGATALWAYYRVQTPATASLLIQCYKYPRIRCGVAASTAVVHDALFLRLVCLRCFNDCGSPLPENRVHPTFECSGRVRSFASRSASASCSATSIAR
jgi:hypothetical protein